MTELKDKILNILRVDAPLSTDQMQKLLKIDGIDTNCEVIRKLSHELCDDGYAKEVEITNACSRFVHYFQKL